MCVCVCVCVCVSGAGGLKIFICHIYLRGVSIYFFTLNAQRIGYLRTNSSFIYTSCHSNNKD